MRSTVKTDFPAAVSHVRAQNIEALDKLDGIGKLAQKHGRQLRKAVENLDAEGVNDALYHLSSLGNSVNSWSE